MGDSKSIEMCGQQHLQQRNRTEKKETKCHVCFTKKNIDIKKTEWAII